MASNLKVNNPIWSEIEFLRDLMPVLIWKFEENPIKTEGAIVSTTLFRRSMAGNPIVNRWKWPEFDLIRDSMTVLVICKFGDDTIKNEGAFVSATISP